MSRKAASVICGNPGVGKTSFGRVLAERLGAVLLDIDGVTERLAQAALVAAGLPRDDRDSPAYKALLREPVYETLFDVACEHLDRLPCVIVGPFTRERRQASWPERLRARLRTDVIVYYLCCDEGERRRRLAQRGNPRDRAKLEDWDRYSELSLDAEVPPFEHRLVDTARRDE